MLFGRPFLYWKHVTIYIYFGSNELFRLDGLEFEVNSLCHELCSYHLTFVSESFCEIITHVFDMSLNVAWDVAIRMCVGFNQFGCSNEIISRTKNKKKNRMKIDKGRRQQQ